MNFRITSWSVCFVLFFLSVRSPFPVRAMSEVVVRWEFHNLSYACPDHGHSTACYMLFPQDKFISL